MGYRYEKVDDEGWIFVFHEEDTYEPDYFMQLLKSIQEEIGGAIYQHVKDDTVYKIHGEPYGLTFQWDDLFGTVIIVPDMKKISEIYRLLDRHIARLNGEEEVIL